MQDDAADLELAAPHIDADHEACDIRLPARDCPTSFIMTIMGPETIAEDELLDLAGGRHRELLHELPVAGGLVWRQLLSARSEEHTSELQSRSDLVCRLLLEKK